MDWDVTYRKDGKYLFRAVIDPEGKPIEGARVCYVSAGAEILCVETSAEGFFKLPQSDMDTVKIMASGFLHRAVAAIDHDGRQSSYSEPGAPLLISAYSSGDTAGITTTDRSGADGYDPGDYTNTFGGTSSSAPLVSGVIALMLEANPNLTYRDVQQILVRTAEMNDPLHFDWTSNAAGYDINHAYGFGAVDATAAVQLRCSSLNKT